MAESEPFIPKVGHAAVRVPGGYACGECDEPWPCATEQAWTIFAIDNDGDSN